jgi:branched-chain amino acid transport system substrate-binding protein
MSTMISRRGVVFGAAAGLAGLTARRAWGQSDDTIRIGVLTALSGPYTDFTGAGSVLATKMAVEDFTKANNPNFKIEVLLGDIQDKADIGVSVARTWFDRDGVDAITDVPNSAVALALVPLFKQKNKVGLLTSPGSSVLTGTSCDGNHVHWAFDTYSTSRTTATAMIEDGGDSWYFITANYAYGHAIENDATRFIKQAGGTVVGSSAFPFPDTTDFASYLLTAQASGAKVVAFAAVGDFLVNLIKQAHEFGLKQRIVCLGATIQTIHGLGLEAAQGLDYVDWFYWDRDDGTRDFATRFAARNRGSMPNILHAGDYSSTMHYLKAVQALGASKAKADGAAAVAKMKTMPISDPLISHGSLRPDGQAVCDLFLYRVKSPAASKKPWDYLDIVRTIPPEKAFRPLADGNCSMIKS